MKRVLTLTLVGVALIFASLSHTHAQSPKYGGTLKATLPNAPPHLDPLLTTSVETTLVMYHVYEGLFELNKKFEVKPHLAKQYTTSRDGLQYNIELRRGVLFHDGSEMTSQDVVASFDRWLKVNNGGKIVAPRIKGFRADGKYNVIIEFKSSYGPFIGIMASYASSQKMVVMKKEIVEKFGDKILTEHIGTGSYQFSRWVPNQFVELARFEKYTPAEGPNDWYSGKKVIYVDKLVFEFVKEDATRVAGVETGQYDFTQDVPTDQYDMLAAKPNVKLYIIDPDAQLNIAFNRKKGRIFSNVNARRAIAAALDMEEIMGSANGNPRFWRLNHAMFNQGNIWYSEKGKEKYNVHDIGKAKQLLAMAAYDGKPVKILGDLASNTNGAALAIKNQLKALGMEVTLDLMERATMSQKRIGEDWDMHLVSFRAANPIPDVFGGWTGTNKWIGFWDDEDSRKMDQLFDDLAAPLDHAKRFQQFEKLQEFYWDVVPILKLGDAHRLQMVSKRVRGFENTVHPIFANVWLED
jgi:peptide/nickel transport system substrate-binding protein